MIDTLQMIDCVFDELSFMQFQSSTINKTIFDRCKMLGGIVGTPRDLTVRDCFVSSVFKFGPTLGATERVTLINSHIQSVLTNNQSGQTLPINANVTFSNGTLKVASGTTTIYGLWSSTGPAVCPMPWAIPGAKIAICMRSDISAAGTFLPSRIQDTCGMMTCFTVLDVYEDGAGAFSVATDMTALPNTAISVTGTVSNGSGASGNILHVTAISPVDAQILGSATITGGGLPGGSQIAGTPGLPNATNLGNYTLNTSALIGSTVFTVTIPQVFLPHDCPRMTVINCTGGRFVTDMAGAPPDIPMYSYFHRAYAGQLLLTNDETAYVSLAGNVLFWRINVIRPYTGGAAAYKLTFYPFGYKTAGGITYPTFVTEVVDLKTVGLRTITATGISGNVGTDAIVAIPFFVTGGHPVIIAQPSNVPFPGDTLANMPLFTMTAQTDQGISFPSIIVNVTDAGAFGRDEISDTATGTTLS